MSSVFASPRKIQEGEMDDRQQEGQGLSAHFLQRCLPSTAGLFPEELETCVLAGLVTRRRRIERAGRSFLSDFEEASTRPKNRRGRGNNGETESPSNRAAAEEEYYHEKWKKKNAKASGGSASGSGLSSNRLKRLVEGPNLYKALGVPETAAQEEIRRAYRRLALVYHPDKKATGGPNENVSRNTTSDNSPVVSETSAKFHVKEPSGKSTTSPIQASAENTLSDKEMFLLIQEAYEALCDRELRRQYDSALPFDDSIPTVGEVDDTTFFEVLPSVFERNARFSVRRPVPSIGDPSTPLEEVRKFYDFWYNFQTWRDFAVHDEYDYNDAECREERRWMERENLKSRRKHLRTESARVSKLVELAYSKDPRILAQKAEQRRKKEEEKAARLREIEAEKERARQEEEEERRQRDETLRKQKEEEQRRAELRQQQKAVLKKWRQALRHLCSEFCRDLVVAEDLQELCLAYDVEQLERLCAELTAEVAQYKTERPNGRAATHGDNLSWAPPDILGFTRSTVGLSDEASKRLAELVNGRITAVINQKAEDEAAKTDHAERRRAEERRQREEAKRRAKMSNEWTADEMSLLAKALQKFPGGTAARWQQIASFIGTRSSEEVVEKAKEMAEGSSLKLMGSRLSSVAFDHFKSHNQGAFKKIDVDPDKRDDGGDGSAEVAQNAKQQEFTGNGAPSKEIKKSSADNAAATESEWTAEQQTAFEKALAAHPSSMAPNERWTAIAQCVPGKTKKECIARFKEIRQAILSRKSGGA